MAEALDAGAELIFIWGGDGMVQRCIDAAAGSKATIAIVPAGTANLFASNLGIPKDIRGGGRARDDTVARRKLDVGRINGEHFAVMAGAGLDALMIRDADGPLKDRLGRAAYVFTGAKNIRTSRVRTRVRVDGEKWFDDKASCVLVANVGKIMGDDRRISRRATRRRPARDRRRHRQGDVAVVASAGAYRRREAPTPLRSWKPPAAASSTCGSRDPIPYELDGGDRKKTKRLRIKVRARRRHRVRRRWSRSLSTATTGTRDVGSRRRRRVAACFARPAVGDCWRTRSCGCGWPTDSAMPRSLAYATSLVFVQAIIAVVGLASARAAAAASVA